MTVLETDILLVTEDQAMDAVRLLCGLVRQADEQSANALFLGAPVLAQMRELVANIELNASEIH